MNYPIGKGYFIWLLYRVAGGDPKELARLAKEAGLSWVTLKIADGPYPFFADQSRKVDLVPAAVQELHNVGIKVFGWHYVYGYPIGEADMAVKRVRDLNLDGYIIDAEVEYKRKAAEADTFMSRLRRYMPVDTSIGICSYRFPNYHPEFPWKSFVTCDFNMPQVYWSLATNAGQQLQRSVYEFGQLGYSMPIFPVGAAYPENGWRPTVDQIIDFRNTVGKLGLPGYSWWEWYYATIEHPEYWAASVGQIDGGEQQTHEPILMVVVPKFKNVNMRSGPSITCSFVGRMVMGTAYNILEIKGKWGRIEGLGHVWCHLDYVTKIAGNNTQQVIKFGEILGFMTPNKAYGIVQIEADWGKLSGESEQWVNLNYTVGIS
jgi:hypothetical protein